MQKRVQRGFWTPKKEASLIKFYQSYVNSPVSYVKIAKRYHGVISANAIYKKLGRMGLVNAPWVNTEKTRSR